MGVQCLVLVLLSSTLCPSSFAIILMGKVEREREREREREERERERENWLLHLIVFLMSCDCWCSVALPHGAVGWS